MSDRRAWLRWAAPLALAVFCASFLPALLPALADDAGARCCRGGCCCAPARPAEGTCLRSACGCGEGDASLVIPIARPPALLAVPLGLPAPQPASDALRLSDARADSAERRVPDPPPRLAASHLG